MIFFAICQDFVESIHPAMNPAFYEDIDEENVEETAEENAEEKDVLDVCENNITINDGDVICNCNICSICRYIMNHCGYRNAKLKGI